MIEDKKILHLMRCPQIIRLVFYISLHENQPLPARQIAADLEVNDIRCVWRWLNEATARGLITKEPPLRGRTNRYRVSLGESSLRVFRHWRGL